MNLFKCTSLAVLISILAMFCPISYAHAAVTPFTDSAIVLHQQTEYFEDGQYVIISLQYITPYSSGFSRTSQTLSAKKTYTGYNQDGEALWSFILYGDFSVETGVSSQCIRSSYSTNIYNSSWNVDSASSYTTGNMAVGDATFEKKLLFITTDTKSCHVELSCDINGNFH